MKILVLDFSRVYCFFNAVSMKLHYCTFHCTPPPAPAHSATHDTVTVHHDHRIKTKPTIRGEAERQGRYGPLSGCNRHRYPLRGRLGNPLAKPLLEEVQFRPPAGLGPYTRTASGWRGYLRTALLLIPSSKAIAPPLMPYRARSLIFMICSPVTIYSLPQFGGERDTCGHFCPDTSSAPSTLPRYPYHVLRLEAAVSMSRSGAPIGRMLWNVQRIPRHS